MPFCDQRVHVCILAPWWAACRVSSVWWLLKKSRSITRDCLFFVPFQPQHTTWECVGVGRRVPKHLVELPPFVCLFQNLFKDMIMIWDDEEQLRQPSFISHHSFNQSIHQSINRSPALQKSQNLKSEMCLRLLSPIGTSPLNHWQRVKNSAKLSGLCDIGVTVEAMLPYTPHSRFGNQSARGREPETKPAPSPYAYGQQYKAVFPPPFAS